MTIRLSRLFFVLMLSGAGHAAEPAPAAEPQAATTGTGAPDGPHQAVSATAPAVDITRPSPAENAASASLSLAAQPGPAERRWLTVAQARHLALVLPATTARVRATVILLPETGESPDDPALLAPLAARLANLGYSTWRLGLTPVPLADTPVTTATPGTAINTAATAESGTAQVPLRPLLAAALAEITQAGSGLVVVAAHGDSLVRLLGEADLPATIGGLVGLDGRAEGDELATRLNGLALPMLDIVAEQAGESMSLNQRQAAGARAPERRYEGLRILATDHRFTGEVAFVAHRLASWADRRRPRRN